MIHIYIQVHALGPSFIEPARYVKITIYIFTVSCALKILKMKKSSSDNDMLQSAHQRLNLVPIEAKNELRYMHITEKAR